MTKGAAANLEPHNHLRAMLCVLGAIPFWCHENIRWRRKGSNIVTPKDLRNEGIQICAGWKREVARLAGAGYYKDHPDVTRFLAELGLGMLAILCSDESGEIDKEKAKDRLTRIFTRLTEKQRKFPRSNDREQTAEPETIIHRRR
jgi:hypothetical protein